MGATSGPVFGVRRVLLGCTRTVCRANTFSRGMTRRAVGGLHAQTKMRGVAITGVSRGFSPGHNGCCPGGGAANVLMSPIL